MANISVSRKSGFIRRSGVMRRESLWAAILPVANTLAAGSTAVLSSVLGAGALNLRPFTIVRTRGFLHVRSDSTVAAEFFHAALGFAVVSDQASAVGVTAVPTPDTERSSDLWFLFAEGGGNGFTAVNEVSGQYWEDFDSKAMRKVEDGQDMVIVKETSSISLGAIVTHGGRFLIKLH